MKLALPENGNRSILPSGLTTAVLAIIISYTIASISHAQSPISPPMEFYKEKITMIINDGEFTILGSYYFRNNTDSDRPMPIVFPFHIDDSTHYPYEIMVFTNEVGGLIKTLDFEENRERGSIRVPIPMKAHETTIWNIQYKQKIDKPQATYILKSTQAWGKPLEDALYKIDIPNDIDIDYIWADVDSVTNNENREILWIHKTEYMPFSDMIIKWKKK